MLCIVCCNSLDAQNQRLSKSTYRALNNYVVYSNEVVYAVNQMFYDFVHLNGQFYLYVEDSINNVIYKKDNILTNYEYFPIFPRDLYLKILNDNIYIPYTKRGNPLMLIGKVANVLKEIEDTRSLLSQYIETDDYKLDTNLVQGFKWLRRMEVLYYDVFTLQEKLHWKLTSIIQGYRQPKVDSSSLVIAQELQPLLRQVKLVIKSVRAKDNSSALSYNSLKLAELIRQLELRRSIILKGAKIVPSSLKSPERRFDNIIKRAKNTLKISREYKYSPRFQNEDFKPHYYYYNINLLDNHNRSGDGAATLFNKFIDNSGIYWLFEHEMPQMFEVSYPDVPEYEQYKTPDFDVEKIIQNALKAQALKDSIIKVKEDSLVQIKQDSLDIAERVQDSVQYRLDNPEVGDMNLTGFASNNLVFLLDISSSMKDTNKLPLLKDALKQLLELMREEDNITLITYSGKSQVIVKPTSAKGHESEILKAIENLSSSGYSDANKGLRLAYKTIEESIIKNGNNRIIMATDGAIKVSRRVKQLIKRRSRDKENVRLSVFYFSKKEYTHHKVLLEELANAGTGKYSYIKKENAKKILVTEAQSVRKKDK